NSPLPMLMKGEPTLRGPKPGEEGDLSTETPPQEQGEEGNLPPREPRPGEGGPKRMFSEFGEEDLTLQRGVPRKKTASEEAESPVESILDTPLDSELYTKVRSLASTEDAKELEFKLDMLDTVSEGTPHFNKLYREFVKSFYEVENKLRKEGKLDAEKPIEETPEERAKREEELRIAGEEYDKAMAVHGKETYGEDLKSQLNESIGNVIELSFDAAKIKGKEIPPALQGAIDRTLELEKQLEAEYGIPPVKPSLAHMKKLFGEDFEYPPEEPKPKRGMQIKLRKNRGKEGFINLAAFVDRPIKQLKRFYESANQRVRDVDNGSESAKYLHGRLTSHTALRDHLEKHYAEGYLQRVRLGTPDVQDRVLDKLIDQDINQKPATFTPEEAAIATPLRAFHRQVLNKSNALGILVNGKRPAISNPYHFPSIMDPKIQESFTQTPSDPRNAAWKKEIIDYWRKAGAVDPVEDLKQYIKAIGADPHNLTSDVQFNALRKAEGYGLPKSVRMKSLARTLKSYGQRVGRDFAYTQALQSDPATREILQLTDVKQQAPPRGTLLPSGNPVQDLSGVTEVKDALRKELTASRNLFPRITGLSRLMANAVMGAGTSVRDITTIPSQAIPFLGKTDYGVFLKALSRAQGIKSRARLAGSTMENLQEREFGPAVKAETGDTIADLLNSGANFLYKWTGREFGENAGREYTHMLGEQVVIDNFSVKNHPKAQALLRKLGDTVEGGVDQYLTAGSPHIPDEQLQRMAKRFVDYVQQSYNQNDLPAWIQDSGAAPFFQLARWSAGKLNNTIENVIKPAYHGNFAPLLAYTFGSFVTGAVIQKLNQFMNNKKDFNPTLGEAYAAGDWKDKAQAVLNVMQLGSFMGMGSDMLKMVTDPVLSQKLPRGYSVPTAEIIADVGENLANLSAAIDDGVDPVFAITKFAENVILDNMQTFRMAANHYNKDKVERSQKFRDMEIYEQLKDIPSGEDVTEFRSSNPYYRPEAKEFKRTSDLNEIVPTLSASISKIIESNRGKPFRMMQQLKGLKANSYRTMPNPDTDPIAFVDFADYLSKVYGDDVASERISDFFKQRFINKFKSGLVPSF
ncbi:MAG TPA: hypothetical protein VL854_07050, partial [Nitrososphaeraceae archaeon]|nr:hypothetical protein [Nitrososphaeraceae archaeon]